MEKRKLGRTGLDVSRLTFGCGAVGGLMTKGEAADQDRAVAWAIDNGIDHFDTAPLYGNGASETNLGRALDGKRDKVIVSTKVRLSPDDRGDLRTAIESSIDASLARLRLDHVDLLQLHNTVALEADGWSYGVDEILGAVVPEFERLREAGKTRFLGFTANGDTEALHRLVRSEAFDSAQIFYNILVPSAGRPIPKNYPAQDFKMLLVKAANCGVGSIGVRVLAGGAMSGRIERHPLGMPKVDPIGSGRDYAQDAERARRFTPLLEAGQASSLPELAIRYAISHLDLATTEIGIATLEELQSAATAINLGPLSTDALTEIEAIQASFAEEGDR